MSIAVAVSGGADSLLSLVLAKEHYGEAAAFHARFLPPGKHARKAAERLKRHCGFLGVDFFVVDLVKPFKKHIIDSFIHSYLNGYTPNPCSLCNREMKFGLLRNVALDMGFEAFATGHYARIKPTSSGPGLFRGKDLAKEQSYFLSLVPRDLFVNAVFPLGEWCKSEVYEELKKRNLDVPLKEESQEVCFIPDDDYRSYIEQSAKNLPGSGPITLADNTVLGEHKGLWKYTIGQRKGLGIAYFEPLYVIGKDLRRNRLIVGLGKESFADECFLEQINILVPFEQWPQQTHVQTIYRQKARPAAVNLRKNRLHIRFEQPQSRPCPGQIGTVYSKQGQVLAGGIISKDSQNST